MATIDTYKIDIQTTGVDQVQKATQSVIGLGEAIVGIGFEELIRQTVEMAARMENLADSFGVSSGTVLAFSQAINEAGGNGDRATQIMTKFYQTIDQMANGSQKAEIALNKLGITSKDLTTLSEKELFTKALDSLSKMPAGAERTAAAVEVFGKAIKGIDPAKLDEIFKNKDIDALTQQLNGSAEAVRAMKEAFEQVQLVVLQALSPIISKMKDFKLSTDDANTYLKEFMKVFEVAFAAATVSKVIAVTNALREMAIVQKAIAAGEIVIEALGGPAGAAVLAAGAVAAAGGIALLNNALDDVNDSYLKSGKSAEESSAVAKKSAEETTKEYQKQISAIMIARQALYTQQGGVLTATQQAEFDKQIQYLDQQRRLATGDKQQPAYAASGVNTASQQAAALAKDELDYQTQKNYNAIQYNNILETTLGMDKLEADYIKSNAEAMKNYTNQVAELEKKINDEKAKGNLADQAKIKVDQQEITLISQQYVSQKNLNDAKYQSQKFVQDSLVASQKQLDLYILSNDQLKNELILKDQANVLDGTMTQKKLSDATQDFELNVKYINDRRSLQEQLTQANISGTQKEIDAIVQKTKALDQAFDRESFNISYMQDLQKSKPAGITEALDSLQQSVTPFKIAQQSVMSLFNNMNTALDNFVKTGKLSFKSFALAVIEDLVMIQVRMAEVALFMQGKSFLSALFASGGADATAAALATTVPIGHAVGGDAQPGQPMIVGEQGPELFIPQGAGSILPNYAVSNMQSAQNQSGPISHTVINNNISALDSKSVAQMFVENRKQLLGSVNMAQRELSYGTY